MLDKTPIRVLILHSQNSRGECIPIDIDVPSYMKFADSSAERTDLFDFKRIDQVKVGQRVEKGYVDCYLHGTVDQIVHVILHCFIDISNYHMYSIHPSTNKPIFCLNSPIDIIQLQRTNNIPIIRHLIDTYSM